MKEYYFTGGEPFLNREILEILEAALAQGPVSVLTNGLLIGPRPRAPARLSDASPYSLDLRISIDGWDAATNDPVRGAGTFERILAGVATWPRAGLNPVITVTEACEGAATAEGRARFLAFLREIGLAPAPPQGHAAAAPGRGGAAHPRLRVLGDAARARRSPAARRRRSCARRGAWSPRGASTCAPS